LDYDGTLASNGQVGVNTLAALRRARISGRKLLLVTGRELDSLLEVFPEAGLFDRVVAENGALLYRPATREERVLAAAPSEDLVRTLQERGVQPLSVGRSIIATTHPHARTVLEAIREIGPDLHVIFNKGAVMVLPKGTDKGTGLCAALVELRLSPHSVLGIGDAENDHVFLSLCGRSVAVANALPALKACADVVTKEAHGGGVIEVVDKLVLEDG
jgi:HAD superfamily hydrolase (TIGR01484 family)